MTPTKNSLGFLSNLQYISEILLFPPPDDYLSELSFPKESLSHIENIFNLQDEITHMLNSLKKQLKRTNSTSRNKSSGVGSAVKSY